MVDATANGLTGSRFSSPVVSAKTTPYLATLTRLELATFCVTGRYSNQLNYRAVSAVLITVTTNTVIPVFNDFQKSSVGFLHAPVLQTS